MDYTARIKDGEVFETTRPADALKAGLDPAKRYEPVLVSVGEGWVLQGLDEAIAGAEADEDISAEVPPEKGFGAVSYSKIRVMRSRKLGDDEEKVSVGDEVEIDGKRGTVRLIASGRIKVDFNHKYAGKTLVYDARVIKSLETDDDKISAILDRHFPSLKSYDHVGGVLTLDVDEHTARPAVRHVARAELFRMVRSLRTVKYVETYDNPMPQQDAGGLEVAEQDGQRTEPEPPAAEQDGQRTEPEPPAAEQDGQRTEPEPPAAEQDGQRTEPEPQPKQDDSESDSVKFWSPDKD